MEMVFINRNQYDVAERHCHRSLANSRRLGVEGEEKMTSNFEALRTYTNLRQRQDDYPGAVAFYNLVVDAYNPVHPQVQEAAGMLIDCLIHQGDYFNAERYADQIYQNLRDIKNGMDQEGDEVVTGAYNLADVIRRQDGDLIKAEKLARGCLRIRTRLYGPDHGKVGPNVLLLAKILKKQGKFGDETNELLERSLAISIRNEAPDGKNTASVNIKLGKFHYELAMKQSDVHAKRSQLLLQKSYCEEARQIHMNNNNPNSVIAAALLSEGLNKLSSI
jgi:tetratricopeptide (TPR) repeat protein